VETPLQPAPPIHADRPLQHGGDDLLGFEPATEGLADQLQATVEGGLLVAVRAGSPGAGRTSFLNLLHGALLGRGVAVLRASSGVEAVALCRAAQPPRHVPAPVILVDDVGPADLDALARLEASGPAVVAALDPGAGEPERARPEPVVPLVVELPRWDARAALRLAEQLTRPAATPAIERTLWRHLLAAARTPRQARRLTNAALAAVSAVRADRSHVLAALAVALGVRGDASCDPASILPARQAADLLDHVRRYCGALNLTPRAAGPAEPATESEASLAEEVVPRFAAVPDPPPLPEEAAASEAHDASDDEIEQRRRRCAELSRQGGPEAVAELVHLLTDAHSGVRLSASHALATLLDPAAAPAVRPLLDSHEPSVRRSAAFVLGRLRDEASRDGLARMLSDVSAEARRAAAAALARLGGEACVRPLLMALDDPHGGVRMAVETALLQVLAQEPEGTFDRLLDDPDEPVRRAALRASSRLALASREALERQLLVGGELGAEAAEALGQRGSTRSLPALAQAASEQGSSLRAAATSAIARITGAPAAQGLATLLRSDDTDERACAVAALACCPGAMDAIVPYLADERPEVRAAAAEALGRLGDQRAVGPLLQLQERGSDPQVRRVAAASLVRLGFDA
jgi:HEAT repeat protein